MSSQFGPKHRHFGRDAEIQAKDGNKTTDLASHNQHVPSMIAGFRRPCRNDGVIFVVYGPNGELPATPRLNN